MTLLRRQFLSQLTGLCTTLGLSRIGSAAPEQPPRVLLRSSWQTVNIGDVAHSPGVMRLLYDHIPGVEVTLWPGNIGNGVEEMLRRNFPQLAIARSAAARQKAFEDCDFLLHGSGPYLVAQKHVAEWREKTGKPYGIYGITLSRVDDQARSLINDAAFIYFRDTISLAFAKEAGLTCPIMEFGPDGAFAMDCRNDAAAEKFLKRHDLEDGRFLVVIPRLRYTPYWLIKKNRPLDEERHAVNERLKESDHGKIREAVIAFVRQTGMKVLLCPEDETHMQIGREMILERLPDDVRKQTVWREDFWLPDEAVSTYRRALALLSMDMHSPIMAVGNGIPAIHCRFEEQTSKGQMWNDIGLGDWLFDLDNEDDGSGITREVLKIAAAPQMARSRVARAMQFVRQRQQATMAELRTH
ncbi:MAG: polysaccharide pyruvyl transferase family protein [Maioricimonas sp. JB049]